MGIKRKLSRLWKETRDGILNGPGLSIDDTNLTITEDGGDLVAKDDVGNVVLRYDEASGSWVMDSLKTGETTLTDNIREQATAIDTDSDSSNALDLSLSGLNDTRAQTVYLDLNGSGGGAVDLKIQINNDTTTAYAYVIQNTTNTTHTTGDTAFRANYVGGREYFFVFDIGNPRGGASAKPTISQRTQVDNRDRIVQGRYNAAETISSIQITSANGTNPNATGVAAVIEEELL